MQTRTLGEPTASWALRLSDRRQVLYRVLQGIGRAGDQRAEKRYETVVHLGEAQIFVEQSRTNASGGAVASFLLMWS